MDWTKGYNITYEFYELDRVSWTEVRKLTTVKDCVITKDDSALIDSATMTIEESIGEKYIRAYLVATQNETTIEKPENTLIDCGTAEDNFTDIIDCGTAEDNFTDIIDCGFIFSHGGISKTEKNTVRVALVTVLVQTPSTTLDGKVALKSLDCYSVLKPLTTDYTEPGQCVRTGENIIDAAVAIIKGQCAAPVSAPSYPSVLASAFTADDDQTLLDFVTDMLDAVGMHIEIDGYGTIIIAPDKDIRSLLPAWVYNDDNSSILYPDATDSTDWFDVVNNVKVIASTDTGVLIGRASNDDPNSPFSTVSRGYKVTLNDSSPTLPDNPTQEDADALAQKDLNDKTATRTIIYKHGYCPVSLMNAVRLNYSIHNIDNVGMVTKQVITCATELTVEETAISVDERWSV